MQKNEYERLSERPAAEGVSPERRRELVGHILDYMAEYFQDDQLYDILHHSLEMSHEEIEALGFALHDQYECQISDRTADYVQQERIEEYVQAPLSSPMTTGLIATYEDLLRVPDSERTTEYFGDYGIHVFKYGITEEQKQAAYDKALAAIEMDSESFQRTSEFTYRGEIISRMRDCLLAGELRLGEEVLFVNTVPYCGPGDFALSGGIVKSVDAERKTCSIKGEFLTMDDVPLHYVLGRHNPDIQGRHYGFRHLEPLFGENAALADHYLREAEEKWNAMCEQSRSSAPQMGM